MLKVVLSDPAENESAEEILWYNLEQSDKYLDLNNFAAAASCYIKTYPNKNYQDLEKELRERNFNTHLCASQPKNIPTFSNIGNVTKPVTEEGCDSQASPVPDVKLGLGRENDATDYQYECIFSCRRKNDALKEVLSHWSSYDENFLKLANCGFIIVKNPDSVKNNSDTQMFNNVEMQNYDHIVHNRKKLMYTKVSASDYLDNLVKMCKSEFGKSPEEKIVGVTKAGNPIFGVFLDDKLVDTFGFYVERIGNDDVMKLFNLKQLL